MALGGFPELLGQNTNVTNVQIDVSDVNGFKGECVFMIGNLRFVEVDALKGDMATICSNQGSIIATKIMSK